MDRVGGARVQGETLDALLRRCADGEHAAFRRLYELQAPILYGLALHLLRRPDQAADVLHDCFILVRQQAGRFDPAETSAEIWLASLLRDRALQRLRHEQRVVSDLPSGNGEDLETATTDAGAGIGHCLAMLQPGERRLLELAYLDGLSHTGLAVRLGISLGTVKSELRRALVALRECLPA